MSSSKDDFLDQVMRGMRGEWSGSSRAGQKPAFVRFAPGDNGVGLLNAFFEHPDSYVKNIGPDGRVRSWGLYPYVQEGKYAGIEEVENIVLAHRQMATQMRYAPLNKETDLVIPEEQFLEVVMKRKKHELKTADLGDLTRRDYVLKIHLLDYKTETGEDRAWRRFVVSGGISLAVLQDKIIQPLMGWDRNAHAFRFTDYKDGTQFGPKKSRAADMCHRHYCGFDFLDHTDYCLARVLRKAGEVMYYMYDLGDRLEHDITVEEILPRDESCGTVQVLGGSGMCPMENPGNIFRWIEKLDAVKSGNWKARQEALQEIYWSQNYRLRKMASTGEF